MLKLVPFVYLTAGTFRDGKAGNEKCKAFFRKQVSCKQTPPRAGRNAEPGAAKTAG